MTANLGHWHLHTLPHAVFTANFITPNFVIKNISNLTIKKLSFAREQTDTDA